MAGALRWAEAPERSDSAMSSSALLARAIYVPHDNVECRCHGGFRSAGRPATRLFANSPPNSSAKSSHRGRAGSSRADETTLLGFPLLVQAWANRD
jgi:hypothetical protein